MKQCPSFLTVAVLGAGLAGLARTDDALASGTLEKHMLSAQPKEQGT